MPSKKPSTTSKNSKSKKVSDQGDLSAIVDERPPKKSLWQTKLFHWGSMRNEHI